MIMARCRYKTLVLEGEWECPLYALPGEEYCYWHKEEDGKKPTEVQLKELKEKEIAGVYLRRAELFDADLQEARLINADLQEAKLSGANLQGVELWLANLHGADLNGAKFDSKTNLDGSILIGANLYHSYFDETKSLRNAIVFQKESDKEINEILGDVLDGWFIKTLENSIKHPVKTILDLMSFIVTKVSKKTPSIPLFLKPHVLDMGLINERAPTVAAKFRGKGLIRYAGNRNRIIFFDRSSGCVIENPETDCGTKTTLSESKNSQT